MPLQQRASLIEKDCFVQPDLSTFEAPHDLLELGKCLFEVHRRYIGGNVNVDHLRSS
jgi:hypothetical protein